MRKTFLPAASHNPGPIASPTYSERVKFQSITERNFMMIIVIWQYTQLFFEVVSPPLLVIFKYSL